MVDTTYRLFPLTGMLLLPGTFLPLNVFEPRYRKLVARALDDDRKIGMIQPAVPARDNLGPSADDPERPELYGVGCVGEVVECEPQPDGRFWIVLRGLSRFRIVSEMPVAEGGYRRVKADLSGFEEDLLEMEAEFAVNRLLAAASDFSRALSLELDFDLLASLPPAQAVNALSAALPFGPAEKQALLEAESPRGRRDLLVNLMALYEAPPLSRVADSARSFEPPTVN